MSFRAYNVNAGANANFSSFLHHLALYVTTAFLEKFINGVHVLKLTFQQVDLSSSRLVPALKKARLKVLTLKKANRVVKRLPEHTPPVCGFFIVSFHPSFPAIFWITNVFLCFVTAAFHFAFIFTHSSIFA